ncbi:T9SS type A sorting domain-containing protein [Bacteroides sp.]
MKYITIICFILDLFCSDITFAQVNCNQGDQHQRHPDDPTNNPAGSATSSGVVSADPNELTGPTGYDTFRWVSINDVLPYTVFFENDPEFAMAAAQKVNVSLDFPNKALMKDFGLGTYSFANLSYNIENSPNMYQTRLDLRDSMLIYVDLTCGLDVAKRQAFWKFSTIDPDNGYAPWQVDRGLLPVNDSTHIGEGFVTFHIKPAEDMHTGDTISFMANIVFDQNDTIPTNRWCVTVDAGNPTSKVIGEQDQESSLLYHLSFEAADDKNGSGIKKVYLYLANNLGTYEEYAVCSPDSILDFEIEGGRQYKLYTIAEDNVGNREPLKEQPDLLINLNLAPTDIALSGNIFQDDIAPDGFIGELTSTDTPNEVNFTYALAEGEGAIHNDMFKIENAQLKTKESFKCADNTIYSVRISTTDEGGLSFSKTFKLQLEKILEKPEPKTLNESICEGDVYDFFGQEIEKAGEYRFSQSNEYMCDSVYVLNLSVKSIPQIPSVTIQDGRTLVSSAENGNQWYKDDVRIEGATEKTYTPEESGTYYVVQSNGNCESQPSDKFYANLSNDVEFTLPLAKGWTWISSNLSSVDKQDPKNLLAPIIDNVKRFVGANSELVAAPSNGLVGNLKKTEPTEAYKIQLDQATELDMSGKVHLPDKIAQPLLPGWNWIGYLPAINMSLTDALANLKPTENDIIKGQHEFATYANGQWVGTLSTLNQCKGYMYYSNATGSFHYPSNRITRLVDENQIAYTSSYAPSSPWSVDEHKYPNNMSMIAQLVVDESIAPVGTFTVGAFCGDECRGIGQYVNDHLFITIYGESAEERISFKAIENVTSTECTISEVLPFANSAGVYNSPVTLHVNDATGIENSASSDNYNIYPNPVRSSLFINGDLQNIKALKVLSVSGASMDVDAVYSHDRGLNVSHLIDGHYILGIVTDKGIVYKPFIKVH